MGRVSLAPHAGLAFFISTDVEGVAMGEDLPLLARIIEDVEPEDIPVGFELDDDPEEGGIVVRRPGLYMVHMTAETLVDYAGLVRHVLSINGDGFSSDAIDATLDHAADADVIVSCDGVGRMEAGDRFFPTYAVEAPGGSPADDHPVTTDVELLIVRLGD